MRKKALAFNRQAEAYEKTAETMSDFEMPSEETLLAKAGMSYLGDVLSLSRKEFNRYVTDHKDHLMETAEKLQSEMAKLAHFAHKAEKRLRDQIQLKVAANLKLCGDMEKYKKWEMKTWQLGALPHGMHICRCDVCAARQPDATSFVGAKLAYPSDDHLPQAEAASANKGVKIEDYNDDALYSAATRANSPAPPCDSPDSLRKIVYTLAAIYNAPPRDKAVIDLTDNDAGGWRERHGLFAADLAAVTPDAAIPAAAKEESIYVAQEFCAKMVREAEETMKVKKIKKEERWYEERAAKQKAAAKQKKAAVEKRAVKAEKKAAGGGVARI